MYVYFIQKICLIYYLLLYNNVIFVNQYTKTFYPLLRDIKYKFNLLNNQFIFLLNKIQEKYLKEIITLIFYNMRVWGWYCLQQHHSL